MYYFAEGEIPLGLLTMSCTEKTPEQIGMLIISYISSIITLPPLTAIPLLMTT